MVVNATEDDCALTCLFLQQLGMASPCWLRKKLSCQQRNSTGQYGLDHPCCRMGGTFG